MHVDHSFHTAFKPLQVITDLNILYLMIQKQQHINWIPRTFGLKKFGCCLHKHFMSWFSHCVEGSCETASHLLNLLKKMDYIIPDYSFRQTFCSIFCTCLYVEVLAILL